MKKDLPSPELLRNLLRYEPDTGKLFWLSRTPDSLGRKGRAPESECKRWNKRYSGSEAFTARNDRGYLVGDIMDRTYRSHRVIWALAHGEWPADGMEIDHINGVRDDNRISNLRMVTRRENGKNSRRSKSNTSGVTGVNWHKRDKKWVARIKVNGKFHSIGYFTNFSDAAKARKDAEVKFKFHPNHGSG